MPTTSLPAQLVRTRLYSCGAPGQFTVAAHGATVFFLRSRADDDQVACLWALDVASGAERLLVDPLRLPADPPGSGHAERDERRGPGAEGAVGSGVAEYAIDPAGRLAACTVGGRLWVVDTRDGRVRALPTATPVSDPRPDPSGQRIAYVCDGALRVVGADGSGDRVVAAPDGPGVTFGVADYAAESSPDGTRGYWWSPDGSRLLVKRVDESPVELWHIADPATPGKPARTKRYPAAGTAVPRVGLWIIGLDDGARTEAQWDHEAFAYAPRAEWGAQGPCVVVRSRDQQTVRLLAINEMDGSTAVLSEQRDACWVQPVPGLPTRTDSGVVLTHADRGDNRHLVVDGEAVTPPGLLLRALLGVDGDEVLFSASDDPTVTHLWSYRVGEKIRRLSDGLGLHTGTRRGGTLVRVATGADFPGTRVTVLREDVDADGGEGGNGGGLGGAGRASVGEGGEGRGAGGAREIEVRSLAERPVLDLRVEHLVLGPRELRAALYLPSWLRPGSGSLPVLMDPYGGAGAQRVAMEQGRHQYVSQWFAEHGFAVLAIDGSGTPGRGPRWEREVYGDIYGRVIEDQVAGLQEAARLRPWLDLGRVGVRGWSFGGSLAAACLLRRPDVFHVAVAGAGVTDQRMYNAPWRERFLGHPDHFPERYEACSLLLDAPKLERPLLLVHGLADDNVFPANTLRLSSALLAVGRPHEVLLLPGVGHAAWATSSTEAMLRHQLRFLQRHLGVEEPAPEEFLASA